MEGSPSCLVADNLVADNPTGISITSKGCRVHHNVVVITDVFGNGIFVGPVEGTRIHNNTVVGTRRPEAHQVGISLATPFPTEVKNNIVTRFTEGIVIRHAVHPSVATQDHNGFWDNSFKVPAHPHDIVWYCGSQCPPDLVHVPLVSPGAVVEPHVHVTPGPGTLFAAPLFVSEPLRDFRLRATSTYRDAGTDVNLPFCGKAPDIGALEAGCQGPPDLPPGPAPAVDSTSRPREK